MTSMTFSLGRGTVRRGQTSGANVPADRRTNLRNLVFFYGQLAREINSTDSETRTSGTDTFLSDMSHRRDVVTSVR